MSKTIKSSTEIATAINAAIEVRTAVAALKDEGARLASERASLQQRNAEIQSLPVPRDDLKTLMIELVDKQARGHAAISGLEEAYRAIAFPAAEGQPLQTQRGQPPVTMTMKTFDAVMAGNARSAYGAFGDTQLRDFLMGGGRIPLASPSVLCFLFGDALKKAISDNFEALCPALAETPPGMPQSMSKRRSEIAKNQERIDMLTSQLTAIEDQLSNLRVAC